MDHQRLDIAPAPAEADATTGVVTAAVRQRKGWLRRMYSPVGVAAPADDGGGDAARKPAPRWRGGGGWMRRLVLPREHALRRRWKALSGAPSRLAAGLPRWKRAWSSVGGGGGGGWAAELADAAAFRVMYVVEAVVLGLALSCFFCCCGCQI
ncbi:unnamed protein product [Urochloa humidicola]